MALVSFKSELCSPSYGSPKSGQNSGINLCVAVSGAGAVLSHARARLARKWRATGQEVLEFRAPFARRAQVARHLAESLPVLLCCLGAVLPMLLLCLGKCLGVVWALSWRSVAHVAAVLAQCCLCCCPVLPKLSKWYFVCFYMLACRCGPFRL